MKSRKELIAEISEYTHAAEKAFQDADIQRSYNEAAKFLSRGKTLMNSALSLTKELGLLNTAGK